jgi:hypothetical protein
MLFKLIVLSILFQYRNINDDIYNFSCKITIFGTIDLYLNGNSFNSFYGGTTKET